MKSKSFRCPGADKEQFLNATIELGENFSEFMRKSAHLRCLILKGLKNPKVFDQLLSTLLKENGNP